MGFSAELVGELDFVGDWGVLTTDRDLAVTGWNRWLERSSDRPAASFIGRPLFDVFPNLVVRRLDQFYRQALGGQTILLAQRLHEYLLPLPPPFGETRFDFMQQTSRIMPLMKGDAICGTVTLVEDVTERVAYETELRERVEALREADRRKDEFLAMLAHELRNPLAPITNAAHLLRLAGHDSRVRENAQHLIERQVSHLVRLVDDLLDVSRVSRGKIVLQKMPLDLVAVIQHAVETSRPIIDSRRHGLKVDLPDDAVLVDGDFVRLAQVVSNLLNNAAKYTDDAGRISLAVEVTRSPSLATTQAVVRVRDNGRGIEPAALRNLFDLFYQVEQNIDRAEGGLGIGLSLVKSLVEMHGGEIEAHSAGSGRGSEFIVRLPMLANEGTVVGKSAGPSQPPKPARILVVDDNRDSADSMAQLLRFDGHDVLTSQDGRQAVEVAVRERPDFILLDIGLPGLNGYQACQAMREAGLQETLIAAMTGYGQNEDRLRAREARFDAHFTKPVAYEELRAFLIDRLPGAKNGG
jgi:signal transduction histidine kinase/ActR/RegA family two-component response regulator